MAARDWDFALEIKGVTLKTLPMERLAQYLSAFAALLGEEARPRFAGIVRGSVVLRAQETSLEPKAITRARVRRAANDDESPAHVPYVKINGLMSRDGARGAVVDREGSVIVEFPGRELVDAPVPEFIVQDTAVLDGVVVGIQGIDDTVHVRLLDVDGTVSNVSIRDMGIARKLAGYFRGETVRVHVHGTWRRTCDGKWLPNALYADSVESLSQESARDAFELLARSDGNGWSTMDHPEELLHELRGVTN